MLLGKFCPKGDPRSVHNTLKPAAMLSEAIRMILHDPAIFAEVGVPLLQVS